MHYYRTLIVCAFICLVSSVRAQPIKIGPLHMARPLKHENSSDTGDIENNENGSRRAMVPNERKRSEVDITNTSTPSTNDIETYFSGKCACVANILQMQIFFFVVSVLVSVGIMETRRKEIHAKQ
jgi:hypothetical protein